MISKRDCLNILQSDGNWWEYYAQAIIAKRNNSSVFLYCIKWYKTNR